VSCLFDVQPATHNQAITIPQKARFATLLQTVKSDGFRCHLQTEEGRRIELAVGKATALAPNPDRQRVTVDLGWQESGQAERSGTSSTVYAIGALVQHPTVTVVFSDYPPTLGDAELANQHLEARVSFSAQSAGARGGFAVPCRGAKGVYLTTTWEGDLGVMERAAKFANPIGENLAGAWKTGWKPVGAFRSTLYGRQQTVDYSEYGEDTIGPVTQFIPLSGHQEEILVWLSKYHYSVSAALTAKVYLTFVGEEQVNHLQSTSCRVDKANTLVWIQSLPITGRLVWPHVFSLNGHATNTLTVYLYGIAVCNPGFNARCAIPQFYIGSGSVGTATTAALVGASASGCHGLVQGLQASAASNPVNGQTVLSLLER
jgi:hypothetical protein